MPWHIESDNPDCSGFAVAKDADGSVAGCHETKADAHFDYLSSGNILIVNESRQADDRALTGQASGNVPTYRIVTPAGVEVKAWSAVSAEALGADMWHGAGVTANGFALRFDSGGAKVRMFDNAGNPTTTNINIAALTGIPATQGHGGRGDSVGFHGNGRDAYVQVNRENTSNEPYITVLNADGTLRWTRRVGEEGEVINATRVDGAIAPDGRAIAVWASPLTHTGTQLPMNYVQARLFKPDGTPFGSRFLVSEWERPDNAATINHSVVTAGSVARGHGGHHLAERQRADRVGRPGPPVPGPGRAHLHGGPVAADEHVLREHELLQERQHGK